MKGLMLGQTRHQIILRNHLEAFGTRVEYGTTLLGLEQNEEGVTAELSKPDDASPSTKATFAYVVGADGARSMTSILSSKFSSHVYT